MNKFIFALILIFGSEVFATQGILGTPSLYEFVAPSVAGEPAQTVVGQIFYDTMSDRFKAVNKEGAIIPLTLPEGANPVSSGGSLRIEKVHFDGGTFTSPCTTTCTMRNSSSTWLTSVVRLGTGNYQLNFAPGTFTDAPACTFTCNSSIGPAAAGTTSSSTSAYTINTFYTNSGGNNNDSQCDVICVGHQ